MFRQPHANSRSQPTPRVGNLSGRSRQVETDGIRSASLRSGTQQAQSRGPLITLPNEQPSRLRPAPPNATGVVKRPPKRPRRRTIQSTTYNDIETEPDGQAPTETIRLSNDSSDEYQYSRRSDQTESNTEPDTEDNDILYATGAGLCHRSLMADGRTNTRVSTVRVSTTSGSQEAALVRRTQAARGRVVPGKAYAPPVPLSSSVARYSAPLATHSATTSRDRSSSPTGKSSTPHYEHIWLNTPSH